MLLIFPTDDRPSRPRAMPEGDDGSKMTTTPGCLRLRWRGEERTGRSDTSLRRFTSGPPRSGLEHISFASLFVFPFAPDELCLFGNWAGCITPTDFSLVSCLLVVAVSFIYFHTSLSVCVRIAFSFLPPRVGGISVGDRDERERRILKTENEKYECLERFKGMTWQRLEEARRGRRGR